MTEENNNSHYVTDSEAARSFCPMSMNKKGGVEFCYGSNCMAWRWKEKKQKQVPESIQRLEEPNLGYCGLVRG